jgi:hypothetical protein
MDRLGVLGDHRQWKEDSTSLEVMIGDDGKPPKGLGGAWRWQQRDWSKWCLGMMAVIKD